MNYSNSPLAKPYDWGTKNSNPRANNTYNPTGEITKITIHHMAGKMTAKACADMHHGKNVASANYYIGYNGEISCGVPESRRSWCSSSPTNDYKAITIEVSNNGGAPDWPVSDKSLKACIDLCIDICKRNGIKSINYTGDKSGNLTMHCWFTATSCPGPTLKSLFPKIAEEINKGLSIEETKPAPAPSQPAPTPATPDNDTIEALAKRVLNGEFGNGEARKKALGDLYPVVQAKVNELLGYTKKVYWRVQCGAFRDKGNAINLQNKLKAKGYDTYLVFVNNLYKVQLGAFTNKLNAETLSSKLSFDGFDTYIVQY